MASLNKAILIGNITRDIELKQTPSGVSVATFTIAVQRRFKNADGTYDTDFINIVAWRQTAEFIANYFGKGRAICVVGSIQVRNYTDQQGNKRYVTEVIADEATFVDRKSDSDSGDDGYQNGRDSNYTQPVRQPTAPPVLPQYAAAPAQSKFEDISPDEDLPF